MKITNIRLSNFRVFDKLNIPIKPITLLTGMNSTGKSTILNSFASLLQTNAPHSFPFAFTPNGSNCSLGSYKDIVNGNNTRKSFGIGFDSEHQYGSSSLDISYRFSITGDHIKLRRLKYTINDDILDLRWKGYNSGYKCSINAPSFRMIRSNKQYIQWLKTFVTLINDINEGNKDKAQQQPIRIEDLLKEIKPVERFGITSRANMRDLPQKLRENPIGNYILNQLSTFTDRFHRQISYIGPVRAIPLRYYLPNQPQLTIDSFGENTASLIEDWYQHNRESFNEVIKLLRSLELINQIQPSSDENEILSMYIQPFINGYYSNLADVGFGVSQSLPFIIADVSLPENSVLLINQPEVHLHPSAQAKLGNYFASRINKRQYIIETHSEYLINRLRLLVTKGVLNPNDVSIIYFAMIGQQKPSIKPYIISLQKDGALDGAPKHFFDTYFSDTFEMAMEQ